MRVSLRGRHFVYTYLSGYEFIFGDSQTLYVVAFRRAAVLPFAFLDYTLTVSTRGGFGEKLRSRLDLPDNSSNVAAMKQAAETLEDEAEKLGRRSYFRPNIRILPPPYGPVDLGHIVADIHHLEPLNGEERVIIPEDQLYCLKRPYSESFGHAGKGLNLKESLDDDFKISYIETVGFFPTDKYVSRSFLAARAIKEKTKASYLRDPKFYMITAFKIVRGGRQIRTGDEVASGTSLLTKSDFIIGISFSRVSLQHTTRSPLPG
jgi:hypothetical protein